MAQLAILNRLSADNSSQWNAPQLELVEDEPESTSNTYGQADMVVKFDRFWYFIDVKSDTRNMESLNAGEAPPELPSDLVDMPQESKDELLKRALNQSRKAYVRHWASVASKYPGISVNVWVNHGIPTFNNSGIPLYRVLGLLSDLAVRPGNSALESVLYDYPAVDSIEVKTAIDYMVKLLGG